MNSQPNPGCRKCGCKGFFWNPGVSGSYGSDNSSINFQGQPLMDNKTDQAAYLNCFCGHHRNYHN